MQRFLSEPQETSNWAKPDKHKQKKTLAQVFNKPRLWNCWYKCPYVIILLQHKKNSLTFTETPQKSPFACPIRYAWQVQIDGGHKLPLTAKDSLQSLTSELNSKSLFSTSP